MIDISQITATAPKVDPSRASTAPGTGNAFGEALGRARGGATSDRSVQSPADAGKTPPKVAQKDNAGTGGKTVGKQDAKQDTRQDGKAAPSTQGNAPSGSPSDTTVAGQQPGGTTTDPEDKPVDPTLSEAGSAAAALAALLGLVPAPATATATAATTGPADADAQATAAAAVTAAALPSAAAAPAAADAPSTLGADTLAAIASQRAAMGGKATTDAAATAAADADGQGDGADTALADLDTALKSAVAAAAQSNADSEADSDPAGLAQRQALNAGAQTFDASRVAGTDAASQFAAAQAAVAQARTTEAGAADATPATPVSLVGNTQAGAQATNAGALPPMVSLPVAPRVGDEQWSKAMSQQMLRLSTQGNHTAELQLNPPDLGPLKVVLNVVNDQAQAQFVSPHAAVRAAVEAAMPHLRNALAENGIQLGQTSVGAEQQFAGQAGHGQQQGQPSRQSGAGDSTSSQYGNGRTAGNQQEVAATPAAPRQLARGEVDTFA